MPTSIIYVSVTMTSEYTKVSIESSADVCFYAELYIFPSNIKSVPRQPADCKIKLLGSFYDSIR